MKVKELISELMGCDQDAEVVAGAPIYFVEEQPAFYDGYCPMLVQDKSLPGYNIVGFKYSGRGVKVQLHTTGLSDCLMDAPSLPVDTSEIPEPAKSRYDALVADARAFAESI